MTHTSPSQSWASTLLNSAFLAIFALSAAGDSLGFAPHSAAPEQSIQAQLTTGSSSSRSSRPRRFLTPRTSSSSARAAVLRRPTTRRQGTGSSLARAVSSGPRVPIKAGCGDGLLIRDLGEECDDKNAAGGDGCSTLCKVETGFSCTGNPSECWSRCGDGLIAANEKCDDANMTGGDGCSATCKVELLYRCSGTPSLCETSTVCGDNAKSSTEVCDDGNTSSFDGCTSTCTVESGWACTGNPSVCTQ